MAPATGENANPAKPETNAPAKTAALSKIHTDKSGTASIPLKMMIVGSSPVSGQIVHISPK
jgi:hypothetical protein